MLVKGRFGKKTSKGFSMEPALHDVDYRPSMFFVPSHDDRGHGVRVVAMVMPETKRAIQTVLSRGVIPEWKTEGDLIRWCIAIGIEKLRETIDDPAIRGAHGKVAMMTEMQRQIYDSNYWRTMLGQVKDQVAKFAVEKEFVAALKILKTAEGLAETIEDDRWRERFEKEIGITYAWTRTRMRQYDRTKAKP